MHTIYSSIDKLFVYILDLFFNTRCIGCRRNSEIVCDSCLSDLARNENFKEKYIFSLYAYQNTLIKKIIWQLKYYNRKELGVFFGKILYQNYLEEVSDMRLYSLGTSVLVLPVPLSKKRLAKRGYNQADIIADSFCSESRETILEKRTDILEKIKDTIPQARITNRKTRIENAHNAYIVTKPDLVKDRNIIIIDDVYTTGGTINEIKRVLEKSGARKVIGITIAH